MIPLVSAVSVSEVIVYVVVFNFLCKKDNYERAKGGRRKTLEIELKWKTMTDYFFNC